MHDAALQRADIAGARSQGLNGAECVGGMFQAQSELAYLGLWRDYLIHKRRDHRLLIMGKHGLHG